MPQWHRLSCKECGREAGPTVRISGTGLCPLCGEQRHLAHNRQLQAHGGPWFDHWRRRSLLALGVPLAALDGPPQQE